MKKMYLFLMLTVAVSLGSFAQTSIGGAGCMDEAACNYCSWATEDSGTCDYTCIGCMESTACNYNPDADVPADCDYDCWGCMDSEACNYDSSATIDNGCDYSCIGCMDEGACNFNPSAVWDMSPQESDFWSVCDYSCIGCTDEYACDYNPDATIAIEDCDYDTCRGCMVEGACDYCPECTIPDYCEYESCAGCMDEDACDYDADATIEAACDYSSCAGCTDPTSCNYAIVDVEGGVDETGSPDEFIETEGGIDETGSDQEYIDCLVVDPEQIDLTGSPDEFVEALDENGDVILDESGSDQEYIVVVDVDGNIVWDFTGNSEEFDFSGEENEFDLVFQETGDYVIQDGDTIPTYTWVSVPNDGYNANYGGLNGDYNPNYGGWLYEINPDYNANYGNPVLVANPDYNPDYGSGPLVDGLCENPDYNPNYGGVGVITVENPDYNPNYGEVTGDGVPDFYVYSNGDLCDYECWGCDNVAYSGLVLDGCGVCDGDDSSCTGSDNPSACNYVEGATIIVEAEFDSCTGCLDSAACNFCFDCTIPFGDQLIGECEYDGCTGCLDPAYYEYNAENPATFSDEAACLTLIVPGCTDANYVEFNLDATEDDGSCLTEIIVGCNIVEACNYNSDVNSPDNTLCLYDTCVGCMDPVACDYNPAATIPATIDGVDGDGNPTIIDDCDYTSCAGCTDPGACNYAVILDIDELGAIDESGSTEEFIVVDIDLTGSPDEFITNWYLDEDGAAYATVFPNLDYNEDYGADILGANPDYNPNYGDEIGDGISDIYVLEDGSCEYVTCAGCMTEGACNYDDTATIQSDDCDLSCIGCMDAGACNYSVDATFDDGTCDYSCIGCMDVDACNFDGSASIMDVTMCDYSCYGCMEPDACNFDENATFQPEDACDMLSCMGCMDPDACDYDETATIPSECADFSGDCYGCSDPAACNFDGTLLGEDAVAYAAWDNGSCDYSCFGCTDDGNWTETQEVTAVVLNDEGEEEVVTILDDNGTPADPSDDFPLTEEINVSAFAGIAACNYNPLATQEDGSCEYECIGCMDSFACNYSENATSNFGCDYDLPCAGCTVDYACNYNPNATIEDVDENGDSVCEYETCAGCMDELGCDYNADFTLEGDCDYSCWSCTDETACNFNEDATADDGSCDYSCIGCMDESACNYNADSTIMDESMCDYSCVGCFDMLACNTGLCFDSDGNAIDCTISDETLCDFSCYGCTDTSACNYDADATETCGDCCTYDDCSGCMDPTSCDYNPNATESNPEDCVDWDSCVGCTEPGMYYDNLYWTPFVNYCPDCTTDTYGSGYIQDGSSASTNEIFAGDVVECVPLLSECGLCADGTLDCFNTVDLTGSPDAEIPCVDEDGVIIVDIDEDGNPFTVMCDNPDFNPNYGEILGCMDWYAVNYDANATAHDAEMCLYYIEGCMDETACNYDMEATEHMSEWCIYVDGICETCSGETDGTGTTVDNDADNDTVCDVDDVCPGEDDTADADGDLIPDACDLCPNDAENDADGDGLCGDVDPCDYDSDNDADGDNICGNVDDCPNDAENDIDGDGICGDVDPCPYDEFNDADGDGVCGDVDVCEGFDDAQDADGDGVPDGCEVEGCTDAAYGNYDPLATDDDGSCETLCGCAEGFNLYTLLHNNSLGNDVIVTNETGEVVWEFVTTIGTFGVATTCLPAGNCYSVTVSDNVDAIDWDIQECSTCGLDGSCEDNDSYVVATSDGDGDYEFGICNPGCTDSTACNYDEDANLEDGSCTFVDGICETCSGESDGTGTIVDNDADDDGVCDVDEIPGCTDSTACEYNELATDDDGSCTYATDCIDCAGNCLCDLDCNGECGGDDVETVWYLDMNGDGCGNSCSGDSLVPGTILSCDRPDAPVLNDISAPLYPDAQYVDNDDCLDCDTDIEEDFIGLSIYPNPASDVLNIEFNSNTNNNVTIEFVNTIGQLISSENYVVTNGLLDIEIDMDKYSKGMYQVNLISNTDITSKMIMVE